MTIRSVGKELGVIVTAIGVIGLAATCLVSWVPVWPFALFEHFRGQYVEAGVVLVALTGLLRLRGFFDAALVFTLLDALPIVADLTANRRALPPGVVVRVLVLNVHTEGTGYAQVRQLIADEHPDVIGLVEVDRHWLAELAPAVAAYAGRTEQPRGDNFGVALYARGEVVGAISDFDSPLPSVDATISLRGAHFTAILTHPLPPVRKGAIEQQNRQFDAIAARARAVPHALIMGDFNATPWSRPFQRLLGESGLCDSRAGYGVQASFPVDSALLRIPIDHVLVSCSIGVSDRRIGRDVGSDHLPVIVDLVIP